MSKSYRIFVEICRIILASTFIFSGFVKAVDPWGTAIKIGEYLTSFGMDELFGWRFFLSIWLTGAEMMLGLMVLFRVRLRITSLFIFAAMTFFTGLTLILAIWNPVEDCGCFGDAIKLSNWGTFVKNLILWPMSMMVFLGARNLPLRPTWRDGVMTLTFATIAFGIGIWSLNHLPIIDFLPYRKGVNLREEVYKPEERAKEVESVIIARDLETGKKREFNIADTTWYDTSRWEYIEMKNTRVNSRVHPTVRDFAVINSAGEIVTDSILANRGRVVMLCAADFSYMKPKCKKRLGEVIQMEKAAGSTVMWLTADHLEDGQMFNGAPCYNMDATTLKTMLRARVGVVVLENGVIVDKKNCRDL